MTHRKQQTPLTSKGGHDHSLLSHTKQSVLRLSSVKLGNRKTHRELIYGYQGVEGAGRDKSGIRNLHFWGVIEMFGILIVVVVSRV